MRERERGVITSLVVLLLVLWLGFSIHRTPRFAGSLSGGVLGVSGALLILAAGAYSVLKRIKSINRPVTRHTSMRVLVLWHVYTGIFGSILGLLHTGHKFQSPLGVALTATMLVVVFSGYVGRHLLNYVSQELREKREILSRLQAEYDSVVDEIRRDPASTPKMSPSRFMQVLSGLVHTAMLARVAGDARLARAVNLADAIADVEYSVTAHDRLKAAFSRWLRIHIAVSVVLYLLLGLHIWSGIRYGLRWFPS